MSKSVMGVIASLSTLLLSSACWAGEVMHFASSASISTNIGASVETDPEKVPPAYRGMTPAEASDVRRYLADGRTAQSAGRWAAAEASFRKALAIEERTFGPDHPLVGNILGWCGESLRRLSRYQDAERMDRRALSINTQSLGELHLETARSNANLASDLIALKRAPDSEPFLQLALKYFKDQESGDQGELAVVYDMYGTVLAEQGRTAEATPLLQAALGIRLRVLGEGNPLTATSYGRLVGSLMTQQRFSEAEPLIRREIAIRQQALGPRDPEAFFNLGELGEVLHGQGRYSESEAVYAEAMLKYKGGADYSNNVFVRFSVSRAINLDDLGRHADAEAINRKILGAQQRNGQEASKSISQTSMGLAYSLYNQHRYAEAAPFLRRSLDISRRTFGPDHHNTMTIAHDLAANLAHQGRWEEAEDLSWSAVKAYRNMRSRESLGEGLTGPGRIARAGWPGGEISQGYVLTSYASIAWAAAQSDRKRSSALQGQAFEVVQDSYSSAASRSFAEASARALAGSGRLGDAVRRMQDLQSRARVLDETLLKAWGQENGSSNVTRILAEEAAISAQLSNLDRQVKDEFPRYSQLTSPRALSITEVQARLQKSEAVLLIAPLDRDVAVFAVGKTSVAAWNVLPGKAEAVEEGVSELRCQLDPSSCGGSGVASQRGVTSQYAGSTLKAERSFDRAVAFKLYRDLIAPVESALAGASRVYVVTAGSLGSLPLQVLLTASSGTETLADAHWFADRYALVSLPAVSNLKEPGRDSAPSSTSQSHAAFIGYGDPVLPEARTSEPRRAGRGSSSAFKEASASAKRLLNVQAVRSGELGLYRLPGTSSELNAMARMLKIPVSSLHLRSADTEQSFKDNPEISSAGIIAVATHGLLPSERQAEEPGLVFTPPKVATDKDDGILTASEAAQLHLSADLILLSACNTAASDGQPGSESLSSLSRAFLYAGAKSLLASHWHVGDASTAALTVEVLRTRRDHPELTRGQALQAAERAVRTGKRPDGSAVAGYTPGWASPSIWAPFVIIENQDQ